MNKLPHLECIHTAPQPKAPMERQTAVTVRENFGIEGDRRAKIDSGRQVTFIEAEVLESAAASIKLSIQPGASRRNFTTRGIDLATLIGRQFQIGDAIFEGAKSCTPCEHMETAVGPGGRIVLCKGGLCAHVVRGGIVRDGMTISVLEK
jgi:MOSC domain-containing protein YiiM